MGKAFSRNEGEKVLVEDIGVYTRKKEITRRRRYSWMDNIWMDLREIG
jgi:hypothetical protein